MIVQDEIMIRNVVLNAFETVMQYRHVESGEHIKRMTALTGILVRHMLHKSRYEKQLTEENYELLITASAMHDIGKVGIKDIILEKPGKLTDAEFDMMKRHVAIGKDIIDITLESIDRGSWFARHCHDIILYHHEHWDGKGYLAGLKGEDIPLSARIVAVVDVYDALTNERCYKEKYSHMEAVEIIINSKGGQFDPDIVSCFCEISDQFRESEY